MASTVSDTQRALLDGKNYGTIATVSKDGQPSQVIVWYLPDEKEILVTSHKSTFKVRNLEHHPWASITVSEGPRFVSIRGRVTIEDDPETVARDFSRIVHRYLEGEAAEQWMSNPAMSAEGRVIMHIAIERVVGQA